MCFIKHFFSLSLTFLRKWEIFIFYKELVHHLNCLIPETGVLDKGHQMGSSSWSRKTEITEIMSSETLCAVENKGKNKRILRGVLESVEKDVVRA